MVVCYPVEMGAMMEAPVWETPGPRAKSWMAHIVPSPLAPNGLEREFIDRGRGRFLYMIDGIREGEPVEIGADTYSSKGEKRPQRWYGVVLAVAEDHVALLTCDDEADACRTGERLADPMARVEDLQAALVGRDADDPDMKWLKADIKRLNTKDAREESLRHRIGAVRHALAALSEEEQVRFLIEYAKEALPDRLGVTKKRKKRKPDPAADDQ